MPTKVSPTAFGGLLAGLGALLGWFKVYVDPQLLSDLALWVTNVITLIGAGIVLFRKLQTAWRNRDQQSSSYDPSQLRLFALVLPLMLLPILGGCTPSEAYVRADRATLDAVSPEYLLYVAKDETLSIEEKARRVNTIETWTLRIRQAEAELKNNPLGIGGQSPGVRPTQPGTSGGAASDPAPAPSPGF